MKNTTANWYSSLETQQAFGLLPEVDQKALVEIHHARANSDNMLTATDNDGIVSDICSDTQERTWNIVHHRQISYAWHRFTIKTKTWMLLLGVVPKEKLKPIGEFNFSRT
jgi:hypothetical protein